MTSSRKALRRSDIFVFGSNTDGRHGKGAALFASKRYGAVRGVGEGLTGRSYAIPTKDGQLRTRSHRAVRRSVETFVLFAAENPYERFFLTPVGTGLAGFDICDIWDMFTAAGLPNNVVLASSWTEADGLDSAFLLS